MLNKKILMLIVVSVFLISFASATVETLGTFKKGNTIDLLQSGANFTFCNISSVRYPINNSVLLKNVQMSKDVNEYNYTLNVSQTVLLGDYIVTGFCSNSTSDIVWAYDFKITPSGRLSSTSESILYVIMVTILFGLLAALIYFIIVLPMENEKNGEGTIIGILKLKYLKIFLIALAYPITIILLNLLTGLAVNFVTLSIFAGILGFLFETMLRLAWPFTVIIIIWIVVLLIKDSNVKRNIAKLGRFRING